MDLGEIGLRGGGRRIDSIGSGQGKLAALVNTVMKLRILVSPEIVNRLNSVLYLCKTWKITLREEFCFKMFENKVLRRIFDPKRNK
jgi:hypothetical protein